MSKKSSLSLTNRLKPRTDKQKDFIQAINETDFLFCNSIFGTGKTWLSCGLISEWIISDKVSRAIICRSTGHLIKEYGYSSGNYREKSLEYFDQSIEYFYHFLGKPTFERLWKDGIIELSGIEIIRGRSFKNSLVILEEAQNCSKQDFLLFLSRIDRGSKVICIGDSSQSKSQNCFWSKVFNNIEHPNLSKIEFDYSDILRHSDIYDLTKQIKEL